MGRALHGRPKLGEEIIFLLKTVLNIVGELVGHLAEKKSSLFVILISF